MICHRCGASLNESTLFCPSCGAPQVRFEAQPEAERNDSSQPQQPIVQAHGISWKDAVIATAMVAIPSGILSAISILSWGCCLWVVGGAAFSIALYRKRAPGLRVDTRSGIRIGALAGLIAAYVSVAVTALSRVAERFVFHQGAALDRFYETVLEQSTAIVQTSPDAQAQWHQYLRFLMSPDGRAAYTLLNSLMTAAGIVVLSAAGGALGVRLFATRKPTLGSHP